MAEDNGDFTDDNSESQMDENGGNIVLESGENVATQGAFEMLNASGFGFDNNTHRVVAEDEIWVEWLKGHPKANTWKSRTIDYDKLSMVFGRDIVTGQFARSSVNATTGNTKPTTQGNANMSGNMDIAIEDMIHDVRMSSYGCGGSCSASRNKKRAWGMSEFMQNQRQNPSSIEREQIVVFNPV
ncbi:hypothetical protein AAC387_Pa08g1346 [Persea americana]